MRFDRKGFTLIELAIVIIVLGILAVIAAPKFISLRIQGIEGSEDNIIGAMREAINIYHAKNIVAGNNVYPSENPFTLLAQAPPNKVYVPGFIIPGDGVYWRYYLYPDASYVTAWYLMCPHWNGDQFAAGSTKGRFYIYQYGDKGVWGHQAGDLWLYYDSTHK